MADIYSTCVHCGDPISGFRHSGEWHWEHYLRKTGNKRGARRTKCFWCECQTPEPVKKEVFK